MIKSKMIKAYGRWSFFCGNLLVLVTFDFQLNVAFGGFCIIISCSWVIFFFSAFGFFSLLLFSRSVVCACCERVSRAFYI